MRTENVNDLLIQISEETSSVPILVTDFMVLAWNVHSSAEKVSEIYGSSNLEVVIKALWAYYLNRGPYYLQETNWRHIIVSDERDSEGGYWRHHQITLDNRMTEVWNNYEKNKKRRKKTKVLEEKESAPRGYKGSRRSKSDLFLVVIGIGKQYCQQYLNYFSAPGFEADDWAGAIFRLVSQAEIGVKSLSETEVPNSVPLEVKRLKLFYTIDRDWTQLVNHKLRCLWATTRKPGEREMFQDRVASDVDIIAHAEIKLGHKISSPQELAIIKSKVGDMGDNLPPGTPIEYMSLIHQHPLYCLEEEAKPLMRKLLVELRDPRGNTHLKHMREAEELLIKLGILSSENLK